MGSTNAGQGEQPPENSGDKDDAAPTATGTGDDATAAPADSPDVERAQSDVPSAREPETARPSPEEIDDAAVEARWADIVASFGEVAEPAEGSDARGGQDPAASAPRGIDQFPVAPWVRGNGPRDTAPSDGLEDVEDEQSHFVPPEPPRLLGRDPLLNLAWALVAVTPVVLLLGAVFTNPFPRTLAQVCGVGFVAGLGVLVWRMPHRRDPDDRDPGAVV